MADHTSNTKTAPVQIGGKVIVKDRLKKEMLKPLMFGNHQKKFKIFTAVACTAMTWYLVFKHDFGPNRHCFTWLREYANNRKQQFFSIDPNDKDFIKMKEKHTQQYKQQQQTDNNNNTVQ